MPPQPDTDQNRWIALYVLCMGVLMIVIDATIVNVALPSIQDDLGFSQSNLAWVVNAYMIPFGGLLLLSGRLGDLIGQRKIFLIGLAVFTAASLVCAVAQTQGMLIGARFVQGAGGALSSAVVLAMIVRMFPQPAEQAKAIGVFGFVASAGGSIGLLAGGALTEAINWHWIFFINVPIGIATALLARRFVPAYPGIGLKEGADIPGATLLTAGLMLGVYNILQISEEGWFATQTLILSAISLGLIGLFILRQARISNPLVPLRLFRSANVSGANVVQALVVAGHVRDVLHGRAVHAARSRLRPARGRARVPAGDDRDGDDVAQGLGPGQHALRPQGGPDSGAGCARGRAAADGAHAGRCLIRRRPVRPDGPDGPRRGPGLPRPDDARDVGRRHGGLGARLGPGQHERPGRRSDRARRARHPGERPHRRASRAAASPPWPRSTAATTSPT